jgi:peptidoglycan/xylan/chitin deacetylase (PgdA/CDA1 family)
MDEALSSGRVRIPVLMYHQTAPSPPKGTPMRGLVVAPDTFQRQMAALHLMGYRGLSMSALEPYLRGEKYGKVFGITFDDGYENNLQYALPILNKYGFGSTCYVVAGLIGKTNLWDREKGIRQVPLMSVEQLQFWVDAGQEIGSHTVTHAMLPSLSVQDQEEEIRHSKSMLEASVRQIGGIRHFCYPYGKFDAITVSKVRSAGYTTATTTERGRCLTYAHGSDPLTLPRVLISRTTYWPHTVVKCLTAYEDRRGGGANS